jgi:hypothetical protein
LSFVLKSKILFAERLYNCLPITFAIPDNSLLFDRLITNPSCSDKTTHPRPALPSTPSLGKRRGRGLSFVLKSKILFAERLYNCLPIIFAIPDNSLLLDRLITNPSCFNKQLIPVLRTPLLFLREGAGG